MVSKTLAFTLALSAAASASPTLRLRDQCQDAYNTCIAGGTPQVACACTLTACLGEDNARNSEYCASATANLPTLKPTTTSKASASTLAGGVLCNPAHDYGNGITCNPSVGLIYPTTSSSATSKATTLAGGVLCNPAHDYGNGVTCNPSVGLIYPTTSTSAKSTATTLAGGVLCNPAHDYGNGVTCNPSVGLIYPSSSSTGMATVTTAAHHSTPTASAASKSSPTKIDGKTWSIRNLIRYCGDGDKGCDYNFAVATDGKTENCTISRMPGSDAAMESWANQNCTSGSDIKISWGYVESPAPAFAVITVTEGIELAWFGVADVNGQQVTPSSPFGSGHFGDLTPAPVYTYN